MKFKKILAVCLVAIVSLSNSITVVADLRSDLAATQQQKNQTSAALYSTQSEISSIENKKDTLLGEIDVLDAELVVTMAAIDTLNGEIAVKQDEIEVTEDNLLQAEQEEEDQYQLMKKRIQFLYENGGDGGWLSLIINGKSIADILNQAEYTQKLYSYDRKCLEEYMEIVQRVAEYKEQLNHEKAELEEAEAEQEAQQVVLEDLLAQKKETCADYEAQINNLEAKASEYSYLLSRQNARIQALQQQIWEEEEAARIAAEAAAAAERAAKEQQQSSGGTTNQSTGDNSVQTTSTSGTSTNQTVNRPSEESVSKPVSAPSSGSGSAVVSYACQFVGNPYVYGGESLTNGADCSGFIKSVYAHFGISLPHSSSSLRSVGVGVSYSEAQPGDIICYSGHCALYLGGGAIVHASDESVGIIISSNAAYRQILAVRRVI